MQPLQGIGTRHLGDLGARVSKVENLAGGDFARGYDDVVLGMSTYFAWANRNKESVDAACCGAGHRETASRSVIALSPRIG